MATTQRFCWRHSIALTFLSLCLFPIGAYVLLGSYTLQFLLPQYSAFRLRRAQRIPKPRKVLITGVNTACGLALARAFYLAGHDVTGADCQVNNIPGIGRASRAIKKFRALPVPEDELATTDYVHALLRVVEEEEIELWVSCSAFTSAIEDSLAKEVIERKTQCRCFGFDLATTTLLCDGEGFSQRAHAMGLSALEARKVKSRNDVHQVLGVAATSGKTFTISKVRPRQGTQGDQSLEPSPILPRRSLSETYQLVSQLSISQDMPHMLEEDVRGEEFMTQAIIVHGAVEAFAACLLPGKVMRIQGLPADSGLHQAMLRYTQAFASRYENELTGPLSFVFKMQESISETGYERRLISTSCSPRIEVPSLLLLPISIELPHAITDVIDKPTLNGYVKSSKRQTLCAQSTALHSVGLDFFSMIVMPFIDSLHRRASVMEVFRNWFLFLQDALTWKDITFELWDPLPWMWQYHFYWPMQLLYLVVHGARWSSLDLFSGRVYN